MAPKLDECICEKCGHYWPFKAAVLRHMKCHKKASAPPDEVEAQSADDEVEEIGHQQDGGDNQSMPVLEGVTPLFLEE